MHNQVHISDHVIIHKLHVKSVDSLGALLKILGKQHMVQNS